MADSTELIAAIIHKLRGPLTAIHGATDVLSTPNATDEQKKLFHILTIESKEALKQLTLLSDFMLLQDQQLTLQKSDSKIDELFKAQTEFFAQKTKAKDIVFKTSVIGTPRPIHADKERLTHVIHTLLENAIKYTPTQGEISTTLTYTPIGISFAVTNTGNIPKDLVDKLFANKMIEKGIGLFLAKAIVDQHSGMFKIVSKNNTVTVSAEIPSPYGEELEAPNNPLLTSEVQK